MSTVNPEVYERDLPFDEAVDVVRRLQALAARRGVTTGVKCGNTLEVLNAGTFLKERVQYLSGQPLHALHAALALQWREAFGAGLPIVVRRGRGRAERGGLRGRGAVPRSPPAPISCGRGATAGSPATSPISKRACAQPEHGPFPSSSLRSAGLEATDGRTRTLTARPGDAGQHENASREGADRRAVSGGPEPEGRRGSSAPISGSGTACRARKCIPACPNDAVFEIDVEPFVGDMPVIDVGSDGTWCETGRRLYRALKPTQIAIFADACNDCGNCDVFCPEDGGPHIEKPRFFGSLESWRRAAPLTGFVLTREDDALVLRGRMAEGDIRADARPRIRTRPCSRRRRPSSPLNWATHEVLSVRHPESRIPPVSPQPAGRPFGEGGSPESRAPSPEPRAPVASTCPRT